MMTTSFEVVSSLRIEPVDTDEYNHSLIKQLSSYHKRTFLQCIQSEPNFLSSPESYPNLCENLVNELNRHRPKCNQSAWLKIFRAWTNIVSSSHSITNQIRSKEDEELLEAISMQLSKDSHKEDITSNHQSITSLLTHCRICLASSSTKMINLFNERPTHHQNHEVATLLVKLNYCSCFTIEANVDDGLPQYICMSCSILIENAYQLKVLCAKTEAKFHELQQLSVVQHDFETEVEPQQQLKIPNVQIDCVDDCDLNELNEHQEHATNLNSDERNVKSNFSTIKTEQQEDIDLTKIGDNNVGQPKQVKAKVVNSIYRRNAQLKPVGNAKATYQCEQCSKCFRIKTSLAIHMRSHTNERPYTCEVCGKAFKTTSAANNHRVVHIESKDFKCSQCPFSTNTKPNLKIHERTHSGIQPYTCKFCTMKFRTASNVVKHMRNIHEKQKANKCDKCHRTFFTRESLRKHSIIHTGLKPFACPQTTCDNSYAWYNGLKKHIIAHHSNENVELASEKVFFEKLKNVLP